VEEEEEEDGWLPVPRIYGIHLLFIPLRSLRTDISLFFIVRFGYASSFIPCLVLFAATRDDTQISAISRLLGISNRPSLAIVDKSPLAIVNNVP